MNVYLQYTMCVYSIYNTSIFVQSNLSPNPGKHVFTNLAPSCIRISRHYAIQDMITIVCDMCTLITVSGSSVPLPKPCNKRVLCGHTKQRCSRTYAWTRSWAGQVEGDQSSSTLLQAELFFFSCLKGWSTEEGPLRENSKDSMIVPNDSCH